MFFFSEHGVFPWAALAGNTVFPYKNLFIDGHTPCRRAAMTWHCVCAEQDIYSNCWKLEFMIVKALQHQMVLDI